jgi:hypothetical protein
VSLGVVSSNKDSESSFCFILGVDSNDLRSVPSGGALWLTIHQRGHTHTSRRANNKDDGLALCLQSVNHNPLRGNIWISRSYPQANSLSSHHFPDSQVAAILPSFASGC